FPWLARGRARIAHGAAARGNVLPRKVLERSGPPAVLVNTPAAQHLEILHMMTTRLVRMIEGVSQARALERYLLHTVDHRRRPNAGQFEKRRRDVVHVMELGPEPAGVFDVPRPGDDQRISRAAEM